MIFFATIPPASRDIKASRAPALRPHVTVPQLEIDLTMVCAADVGADDLESVLLQKRCAGEDIVLRDIECDLILDE